MSNITAYGNLKLIKFTDLDFTLATLPASIRTIRKLNMDSDVDAVMFKNTRPISKKNTALGTTIPYSTPGGESLMQFNMYEDADRDIYNFLYTIASPDSYLNADGRIEHFNQPGVDYTDYTAQVRAEFTPITVEEVEIPSKKIIIDRGMVNINEELKLGQPNSFQVTVEGLGGPKKALLVGTADLSAPIDLSTGGTDKIIKISAEGVTIEVNFGQLASTSGAVITAAIDAAFGVAIATIDANDFLSVQNTLLGAPVVFDDPDTGASGLTLITGYSERTFVRGIVPRMTR